MHTHVHMAQSPLPRHIHDKSQVTPACGDISGIVGQSTSKLYLIKVFILYISTPDFMLWKQNRPYIKHTSRSPAKSRCPRSPPPPATTADLQFPFELHKREIIGNFTDVMRGRRGAGTGDPPRPQTDDMAYLDS